LAAIPLGIPIRRQTLCDWTGWCSEQVEPVVKAKSTNNTGHTKNEKEK
jgi:hypothetical protein